MAKKTLYKKNATQKKLVSGITNSGKLVYSILGKKEKSSNLSDFSDFPCESNKIDNICLEQIASCGFTNVAGLFYSITQLNEDFGFGDISMLIGKHITYAIVTDNGKWYFGHSDDIGQRIHTWVKDFRGREMSKDRNSKDKSFNEELCSDVRKYKRALFICLAISNTEFEAEMKENELIKKFKYERFKEMTGGENPENYTKSEVTEVVRPLYLYNKINAIG